MDNKEEKSSNKGLKIIIAVLLLVITLVIFFIGFILFKGGNVASIAESFKPEVKEETFDLEEFVINLQPENGRTKNYAKIKISLMYNNPKEEKILEEYTSKIRDRITRTLRAKTATEMIDVESVESLKDNLINQVNEALEKDIVKDVYITDIVIQ